MPFQLTTGLSGLSFCVPVQQDHPKLCFCLCPVALCPGNPQILGLSFGKLLQGKSSYRLLTCSFPGCLLYRSFQVSAPVLPGSFNKSLMHLNRCVFYIFYFVFFHFFSVGTLMYSKVPHRILKWKLTFFTLIFIIEPCFRGSKFSMCRWVSSTNIIS